MDGVLWQTEGRPELFTGFGPSAYFHGQPKLDTLDVTMEQREVRRRLRALCPASPGVYGMLDREGQLIYVGMSARLCDRLLTYFTAGDEGAKEQRIAVVRSTTNRSIAPRLSWMARNLRYWSRWKPPCVNPASVTNTNGRSATGMRYRN